MSNEIPFNPETDLPVGGCMGDDPWDDPVAEAEFNRRLKESFREMRIKAYLKNIAKLFRIQAKEDSPENQDAENDILSLLDKQWHNSLFENDRAIASKIIGKLSSGEMSEEEFFLTYEKL